MTQEPEENSPEKSEDAAESREAGPASPGDAAPPAEESPSVEASPTGGATPGVEPERQGFDWLFLALVVVIVANLALWFYNSRRSVPNPAVPGPGSFAGAPGPPRQPGPPGPQRNPGAPAPGASAAPGRPGPAGASPVPPGRPGSPSPGAPVPPGGPGAQSPGAPVPPGGPGAPSPGAPMPGGAAPPAPFPGGVDTVQEYLKARDVLTARKADVAGIVAEDELAIAANRKGDHDEERKHNEAAAKAAAEALLKSYSEEFASKAGAAGNSEARALKDQAEQLIKEGHLQDGITRYEEALKAISGRS